MPSEKPGAYACFTLKGEEKMRGIVNFSAVQSVVLFVLFLNMFFCPSAFAFPGITLVDDLTRIVLHGGDDAIRIANSYGDKVMRVVSKHGKKAIRLLKRHGDDAARLFAHCGDDGVRLLERYGDDVLRLSTRNQTRLAKMSATLADDALRMSRLYGEKAVEALGRYGRKVSYLAKQLENKGLSSAQMREFFEFICEKGERGISFVERHWKMFLGGTSLYVLWNWEQEAYEAGDAGPIRNTVKRTAMAFQVFLGIMLFSIGSKVVIEFRRAWRVKEE